jgi:outer membrane protein assembly factor BamA
MDAMTKWLRCAAAVLLMGGLAWAQEAPQSGEVRRRHSQAEMDALARERTVRVGSIRVEGTRRTRDRILLQELSFNTGDAYDAAAVEESRRLIQNLNIFQFVRFEFEPTARASVYDLVIVARDRWSLLPDVLLTRKSSGRTEIGLQLKERNLLGLNQKLEVEAARVGARDFDITLGWEGRVIFEEPRLFGTYYAFGASVGKRRDFEQIFSGTVLLAEYDVERDTAEVSVGRRFLQRHHLRGKLRYQDIRYELFSGGPPRKARSIFGAGGNYFWDQSNVHPWFVRSGFTLRLGGSVHSTRLGSDVAGTIGNTRFLRYVRLGEYGNAVFRAEARRLFAGDFDTFAPSVGGSGSLRGYAEGQYRGRDAWFVTTEARLPLGRPVWRERLLWGFAAFVDVGDASFRSLVRPDDWKIGAGGGLRLYAQRIVDGILRLDAAYGFDVHDWKILADVGRAF